MEKNKGLYVAGITLAVIIIAAGIIVYEKKQSPPEQNENKQKALEIAATIKADDHILGNPQAEISLVEYSDIECPFCRTFHGTMQKLMADYGQTGKLNWAYRHFPLTNIHPNAPKQAEATECAAELGGNDKFWSYLDKLIITTIAEKNPETDLINVATETGLDKDKFTQCLNSGKYAQKIQGISIEAENAGAQGTPFSIIKKGSKIIPVPGALPYETMKDNIEQLLKD